MHRISLTMILGSLGLAALAALSDGGGESPGPPARPTAVAAARPEAPPAAPPPLDSASREVTGETADLEPAAAVEAAAEPTPAEPSPPPLDEFPLSLPREFGPGPEIRGTVLSESGEPVTGLRVRTTTWRPLGRGCYKATRRLGWSETRPGESFVFHVDANMLDEMPERKGRVPFTVSADGHESIEVTLDAGQWADLLRGADLAGLEFRMTPTPHLPTGPR